MNEKQMLYENYEDAFFAIIINEATELDGKRLLEENEQLKRDPTAEISDSFRKRCLDTISKGIKGNKRKATKGTAKKIIRLLPIVAIIAIFLTAIAYAAVPAFRAEVLDLLLRITPESTTWSFEDVSPDYEAPSYDEYSCWMPTGFEKTETDSNNDLINDTYTDGDGNCILITIMKGKNAIVQTDNENLDYYEYTSTNGNKVIYTQKDSTIIASWAVSNVPCLISITATGNVDIDTIKHISDSFVFIN